MTPQMQQSIQLLQMNAMDLEMLIREEMLENPFLEMADDEEVLASAPDSDDSAAASAADSELSGLSDDARAAEAASTDSDFESGPYESSFDAPNIEGPREDDVALGTVTDKAEGSEEFERFGENDVDWNEQFDDSDTQSYASTREDTEEHDFTVYTRATESLYDSLKRQLTLSTLSGRNYEIGEFLIGNINEDGYLDCSLENLCLMVGYPPEFIVPDSAGSAERVDHRLRRALAKLHQGERAEAFESMKRREILARIFSSLLNLPYDQVAAMKRDEHYRRLLARAMRREFSDMADLTPNDLVLETVGWRLKVDADRVFDVLEIIQEFEPTGVAARDLAECLRLQCEEQGVRNPVLYRVLDNHLNDLQQKRFREIAKAMDVPEEKVTDVFTIISHLNPKPGATKTKDTPQYITPDVFVKKVDGKYMYFLNEGDAGRLMVASNYRRLMTSKGPRNSGGINGTLNPNGPKVPAGQAEYAQEKYKNAVWLIRNIEKRKSTILRVTEAIMDYQKDFLEKGIEFLHPLTLRDIAERVGMHESTIARVTTKKYVETPRGIFELKFFFSSGLETDDGEAASSRSIKELLTQMIDSEEKRRPLSDQKIADMLRSRGFQIARRTVAKYREQLRILPAKLRKEVGS